MKNVLATAIGALLVAGAVAANAASLGTPVIPGATTAAISTPHAHSGQGSEALPNFQYQGAVPLTSGVGHVRTVNSSPWNVDLAHQTGGNR